MSNIRDLSLAKTGERRLQWAIDYMPLLHELERQTSIKKPLRGKKISVCVHLEAKTARLCLMLAAAGAQLSVTGSNPLSTRDDICAALVQRGLEVNAWYGATDAEYKQHLIQTLAFGPDIIIDDGGDFLELLHGDLSHLAPAILGGCEETTTGVTRMKARAREGCLSFPMIAVNDADCKHLFDNRFGTGQSVFDAIMRTTNLVIPGKTIVVAGFGFCGTGVAEKARALGAQVIVTEVNPVRAIEAAMLGYRVMTMDDAAALGDIFITVTGCIDVITARHMKKMKHGAILCNAGHFDTEINKPDLASLAVKSSLLRPDVTGYKMADSRTLCLISEGRLVNICAGDGHPVEIMDMSFAVQALCVLYINENNAHLKPVVYDVPREVDRYVAALKLDTMGIYIDEHTPQQAAYMQGYEV